MSVSLWSVPAMMRASQTTLAATPGIGPTKVKRFHDAMHLPLRRRQLTADTVVQSLTADTVVKSITGDTVV